MFNSHWLKARLRSFRSVMCAISMLPVLQFRFLHFWNIVRHYLHLRKYANMSTCILNIFYVMLNTLKVFSFQMGPLKPVPCWRSLPPSSPKLIADLTRLDRWKCLVGTHYFPGPIPSDPWSLKGMKDIGLFVFKVFKEGHNFRYDTFWRITQP